MARVFRLTAAVLYDTSYLMNGGRRVEFGLRGWQFDAEKNRQFCIPTEGHFHSVRREITHILPDEVKREIHGHFTDAEKVTATRAARKMIADFIAIGSDDESEQYQEVILATIATEHFGGDVLGADSRTDRLLIGYAKQLAESNSFHCICVATEDGGIMVDVNKLRVQQGLNLYCISTRDQAQDQFGDNHGPDITHLVERHATEEMREYRYVWTDLPWFLWKKLFG